MVVVHRIGLKQMGLLCLFLACLEVFVAAGSRDHLLDAAASRDRLLAAAASRDLLAAGIYLALGHIVVVDLQNRAGTQAANRTNTLNKHPPARLAAQALARALARALRGE